MKILHAVEFYDPSVGGAQAVVKQVSEGLVRRGHEVTVATTRLPQRRRFEVNGVRIVEFDASGNLAHGVRGDPGAYRRFLRRSRFDVMMVYAAQQWTCDACLELCDELPFAMVLAPCGFSGLNDPVFAPYFARLPSRLQRFDRLIFHSETYQDRAFCRAHGLDSISRTIPNAASRAEFDVVDDTFRARHGVPADEPMLLTVGSHTGMKGHAVSIRAFARARIGRATLVVVGNAPGTGGCRKQCGRLARAASIRSAGRRRVLLVDPVRTDVVAAYHAADLFVFPSVVECSPLVLFECMAAGLPFIASSAGNTEEIVDWSGAGEIVAGTRSHLGYVYVRASDLAAAIGRWGHDRDGRAAAGRRGQQAWRERFTWEHVVERYEDVYREAVEHRRRSREEVTL